MDNAIGKDLRKSIEALPEQIRQGWDLGRSKKLPKSYRDLEQIVVAGMGGSSLGAHVLATSCARRLNVPLELVQGYDLPAYVGRRTLVILSSYSGTTEETLSCAKQADQKHARCIALTVGGKLGTLANKKRWPLFLLDAEFNPSNQPRMGVGSQAFAMHGLLASLGYLKLTPTEVRRTIKAASSDLADAGMTLAKRIDNRVPLFLAAEHLVGATHVVTNQVNENAKRMAMWFQLPEFNHHFLEALSFPEKAKRDFVAVLFQSACYSAQNQKRIALTAKLLKKQGVEAITVTVDGGETMEETWRLVRLGATASLELALRSGINPTPVPNVEAFKRALAKG